MESIAELDAIFQRWDRSTEPGLVVGIARHGETIYRRAFGVASLESASVNTTSTRMRIGSTSKHLTSLLLLSLAEEGKVDIDVAVRRYIPELSGPCGAPTLRQLMLHRGGSRCHIDLGFLTGGVKLRPKGFALETQIRQTECNFPPGEAMIYNNSGYHLLSIVAERVTDQTFESLLRERFFIPLKMFATESVASDYVITAGIATMHTPLPDGHWRRGLFPSQEVKGEGGIVSTIDDMLIWARQLVTQDKFVSPAGWKALFTPFEQPRADQEAYGLGMRLFQYRGLRVFGHTGGVIGGSCDLVCVPDEDLEVVLLVNGALGVTPALTRKVLDAVLSDRLGPTDPVPSSSEFKPWLGSWWSAETGMVYSLVDDDGALKLQISTQPYDMDLKFDSERKVILPEANIGKISFDFSKPGGVTALSIGFGGSTFAYHKLERNIPTSVLFQKAAIGTYWSADANAKATIFREADNLYIEISDGFAQTSGPVLPLSAQVASVGPLNDTLWCAINFKGAGDLFSAFQLNTTRTRNLMFHRVQADRGA